jgi:tRNA ligase
MPFPQLCDDDFEEHVLGYSPEKTGLHLHGINTCTKKFYTLSAPEVNAFAAEWGLIQTRYTTLKSIADVRTFTTNIATTGAWEGEPIEGFVVRTHVSKVGDASAPYYPGDTFFFKVKFDEPYLMYRDWREVTKILLSAANKGNSLDSVKIPKSKLQREETRTYISWVKDEITHHPELFKDYLSGKGIIAIRERFLDYQQKNHVDIIPSQDKSESRKMVDFGKTVIVPIAIPGSGTYSFCKV